MSDVRQWLESLGLGEHADAFEANEIDWDVIPDLDHDVLTAIGVAAAGARMRILKAIEALESGPCPAAAPRAAPVFDCHPAGEAERRQLTIMFADLVGSTELSQRLDPEDLREVNRAYQDAATRAIEAFGGYVARYMGDGVLAYFGYPQAHEDDAERAVRAGLALTRAVPALGVRPALAVRVGIATGLVIVGDLIGKGASQESAVVGETPNLAARLQGVANPNSVVVADSTRRLIGSRFELRPLAERALKGISAPMQLYQATALRSAPSRFESRHPGRLTPLEGRASELALLADRWKRAREGEGQIVVLEGEPGIGKSRLVEALCERVSADAPNVQRCQCSPYHSATAFHPFIDLIERAAGISRHEASTTKLDKLEALVEECLPGNDTAVPLMAALLSLPARGRAPLRMTPQRRRAETISTLVLHVEAMAARGPMLLVFEDAHWSDPSTVELLQVLIGRLRSLPTLTVITHRPGYSASWSGRDHVTVQSLDRLEQQAARSIVDSVAEGCELPSEIIEEILARGDGIPLFVEELTRAVLESGHASTSGEFQARESAGPLVPSTLHDALTARLDRLGAAKEVAQLGACIGRSFSHRLIAAIAAIDSDALDAALTRLVASGLVLRGGESADAGYTFKHALVQDVARESLLRRRRRQVHGQIVKVLEQTAQQAARVEPELLAHHCQEAGFTEKAARYWGAAGTQALARSDYLEALAHLDAATRALERLDPSSERKHEALRYQSARAEALLATRGYIADETLEAYDRARALCAELGNPPAIFPVLRGIFNGHIQRGEHRDASRVASECLVLASEQADPAPLSLAHRMVGQSAFLTGDFLRSHAHSTQALEKYDADAHGASAMVYGIDLRSAALLWLAQSLCMLGHPDRALSTVLENLAHCRRLGYAFNLALTMSWACYMRLERREYRACTEQAEELLALAREHGLADFIVAAEAHRTLARCASPAGKTYLALAPDCIEALESSWATFLLPFNLGVLASAQLAAGRPDSAQLTTERALALVERTGERWSEAELHRLQGEIALARHQHPEAERWFVRALETALRQRARLWELRCATGLARLLASRGDLDAARALLTPIHQQFTEGFDTLDLQQGKALLAQLR